MAAVDDAWMLDDWSAELFPRDGDDHFQRVPDGTYITRKSDDVEITEELTEELCCEALAQLEEEHAAQRNYIYSLLAFWDTRSDRVADLDCVLAHGVDPFETSRPEVDALVFLTRLDNLRRAAPHPLDLRPEMLQRWEAWASERPRVSGVAPRGAPAPTAGGAPCRSCRRASRSAAAPVRTDMLVDGVPRPRARTLGEHRRDFLSDGAGVGSLEALATTCSQTH